MRFQKGNIMYNAQQAKCKKCKEKMLPSTSGLCHYCKEGTLKQTIHVCSTTSWGSGPHSGNIEIHMNDAQGKVLLKVCKANKNLNGLKRSLQRFYGGPRLP